jgi:hypothetical protein
MWRRVARSKFKKISQDLLSTVKMEAVRAYETKVNFYQTTRRNIPEHGNIQGRKNHADVK